MPNTAVLNLGEYLTVKAAAAYLGVCPSTLRTGTGRGSCGRTATATPSGSCPYSI